MISNLVSRPVRCASGGLATGFVFRNRSMMRALAATVVALSWVIASVATVAAQPIGLVEFYSNADGSSQFMVLSYAVSPSALLGQRIEFANGWTASADHHTYWIPGNLADDGAPRRFLVATQKFADEHAVKPDFIMPQGTLFIPYGRIQTGVFVDVYAAIPSDGLQAVYTEPDLDDGIYDNRPGPAMAVNHAGDSVILAPIERVDNVEYYSAALDDYLLTAYPDEIRALDAGQIAGWQRTGQELGTWTGGPANSGVIPGIDSVCRIYVGTTHFFSINGFPDAAHGQSECGVAVNAPDSIAETFNAFYAVSPDRVTGACPSGQMPVYRLWNPRGASHRYTTDKSVRSEMLARGWVAEGIGSDGVVMCVPAAA